MLGFLGIGAKLLSGGMIVSVILGGIFYMVHTIKKSGAIEVENQILEQAQANAELKMKQSQRLNDLYQESSKRQERKLTKLEEDHKKRLAEIAELQPEEGDNICPMDCIIGDYGGGE